MGDPFNFRLASNGDLDLSIVGIIGDGWAEEPCTVEMVRGALKQAPKAALIRAYVDSPGGSFFEGLGMYQLLHEHPARVEVTIGSRAASAASLLAMSGDEISMHETSSMLIHAVWTRGEGNANDLRKLADDLDRLSASSVIAYASRSGLDGEAVLALLNEDRYMGAAEALKLGFCTHVRKAKSKDQAQVRQFSEQELRAEVAQIKATSRRFGSYSFAAMTTDPRPQAQPGAHQQEDIEMKNLALITAALCLGVDSTEEQAVQSIDRMKASAEAGTFLLKELGVENLDQAKGALKALQSKAELADKQAEEKVKADAARKTQLIKDATDPESHSEHAGKLTPAQKEWAESQSLESLETFLAKASRVVKSAKDNKTREGGEQSYSGKKWEDMTAQEQRDLHSSDKAAYESAYQDYCNRSGR
jgi:ATP-dependent Clp protease, protease subunit